MSEDAATSFRKGYAKTETTISSKNIRALGVRLLGWVEKTIAIVIVLAIWEAIPRLGLIDTFLLPPFSEVFEKLIQLFTSGDIFKHITISFKRSFIGFLIGVGIAIPLGVFMGWYSKIEEIVDPLVQACRSSSVLALYPVFLLLFGLGEVSKTAIIIWGTVWPALLNTIVGVKNTDPALIKAARSMGVSQFTLLYKVVVPASLPYILTGLRLSASNAILVLVAAEMIGANAGLGFMIFYMEERYAVPEMYAGIILLSVIGCAVNYALVTLERRVTSWKEKVHN